MIDHHRPSLDGKSTIVHVLAQLSRVFAFGTLSGEFEFLSLADDSAHRYYGSNPFIVTSGPASYCCAPMPLADRRDRLWSVRRGGLADIHVTRVIHFPWTIVKTVHVAPLRREKYTWFSPFRIVAQRSVAARPNAPPLRIFDGRECSPGLYATKSNYLKISCRSSIELISRVIRRDPAIVVTFRSGWNMEQTWLD